MVLIMASLEAFDILNNAPDSRKGVEKYLIVD